MSMISPKTSVTLGLILSVAAWLVAAVGFIYAFSQSDVTVEPGTISPRHFAMIQGTFGALCLASIGCVLGIEGLVKKWFPSRARVAVIIGTPMVAIITGAIVWRELFA
jgi:hypothetical protein